MWVVRFLRSEGRTEGRSEGRTDGRTESPVLAWRERWLADPAFSRVLGWRWRSASRASVCSRGMPLRWRVAARTFSARPGMSGGRPLSVSVKARAGLAGVAEPHRRRVAREVGEVVRGQLGLDLPLKCCGVVAESWK